MGAGGKLEHKCFHNYWLSASLSLYNLLVVMLGQSQGNMSCAAAFYQ